MRELFSLLFGIAITTACGGRVDESVSAVAVGGSPASATSPASGGAGSTTPGQLVGGGGNLAFGGAATTSGGATSIVVPGLIPLSYDDAAAFVRSVCGGTVVECEGASQKARVFVVDLSDALAQPGTTGSNWDMTRPALFNLITYWAPSDLPVQLNYFPNRVTQASTTFNSDRSACLDSSANLHFLWDTASTAKAPMPYANSLAAVKPLAATGAPIHDAYQQALDLVLSAPADYTREIVLVTAGRPTLSEGCRGSPPKLVDPEPIIKTIADARLYSDVHTTVVGTWGSQADPILGPDMRGWLSKAARAGGTAQANCSDNGPVYCHLDLTTAAAEQPLRLPTVSSCNAGTLSTCTLAYTSLLDPGTIDLQVVTMRDDYGFYLLPRNESKDCEFGWRLSTDGFVIQLCNLACSLWLGQDPIRFQLYTLCPPGQTPPTS